MTSHKEETKMITITLSLGCACLCYLQC